MKGDKEVLVDFYEEIIQEILQPNATYNFNSKQYGFKCIGQR